MIKLKPKVRKFTKKEKAEFYKEPDPLEKLIAVEKEIERQGGISEVSIKKARDIEKVIRE